LHFPHGCIVKGSPGFSSDPALLVQSKATEWALLLCDVTMLMSC
jgi:hypothetical protein